jgi:tRNA1Val (adenine37-N6)-methyltransferase
MQWGVKPRRAPSDWSPSGPLPTGGDDTPSGDEELSYLCGEWRLFQVKQGHRWSLDDLVTAYVACKEAPWARNAMDLGCGLGSVLLLCAWKLPSCRFSGIEAQPDRAAMARRSIRWNGVEDRCQVVNGDLRDGLNGQFELITGTPPYFPPGSGTTSGKTHAEACRFEVRGGVEDYVKVALPHLAPGGVFVVCATRPAVPRPSLTLEVVPKVGKPPLFTVEVCKADATDRRKEQLVVRDETGQWTPQFKKLRATMGLPDRHGSPAEPS